MAPNDKFVNVLFDARQLSALEHIKYTRHISTNGDAVRFCVLEQAAASGWVDDTPHIVKLPPARKRSSASKLGRIPGVRKGLA